MAGIFDITEAFNDMLESISVTRYSSGTYLNGIWVEGSTINYNTQACVLPSGNPSSLINQLNIEGYEGREMLEFYSSFKFRIADNKQGYNADLVTYDNKTYKILSVQDWDYIGGYSIAYGELQ